VHWGNLGGCRRARTKDKTVAEGAYEGFRLCFCTGESGNQVGELDARRLLVGGMAARSAKVTVEPLQQAGSWKCTSTGSIYYYSTTLRPWERLAGWRAWGPWGLDGARWGINWQTPSPPNQSKSGFSQEDTHVKKAQTDVSTLVIENRKAEMHFCLHLSCIFLHTFVTDFLTLEPIGLPQGDWPDADSRCCEAGWLVVDCDRKPFDCRLHGAFPA
jgi:hypothetical protein